MTPPRSAFGIGLLAAVMIGGTAACSSAPSSPPSYDVLVTETSGNVGSNHGQLFLYWSCDPQAEPSTIYQHRQDGVWRTVNGTPSVGALRAHVSCPAGALLTVEGDAAVRSTDSRPTRLRCEVINSDGEHVADESVTRGQGATDPVCRVPVTA